MSQNKTCLRTKQNRTKHMTYTRTITFQSPQCCVYFVLFCDMFCSVTCFVLWHLLFGVWCVFFDKICSVTCFVRSVMCIRFCSMTCVVLWHVLFAVWWAFFFVLWRVLFCDMFCLGCDVHSVLFCDMFCLECDVHSVLFCDMSCSVTCFVRSKGRAHVRVAWRQNARKKERKKKWTRPITHGPRIAENNRKSPNKSLQVSFCPLGPKGTWRFWVRVPPETYCKLIPFSRTQPKPTLTYTNDPKGSRGFGCEHTLKLIVN